MNNEDIARLETENGFRQLEEGIEVIRYYLEPGRPFALRPGLILQLQKVAVAGLQSSPGEWRRTPVRIEGSSHQPPPAHMIEPLVTEMCEYVNDNFHIQTAFHLSAYVMWRHNWIHPFADGNGRTSRILSYIVLCIATGYVLPGAPTIPEQIQQNRSAYFAALEAADEAWRMGEELNLSKMEELLMNMLAKQLLSVISAASGKELS